MCSSQSSGQGSPAVCSAVHSRGFRIGCGPWLIVLSAHILEPCCPRCHAVLAVIEDRRRADRQTGFSALASSTALTDTFVQVVKQFREPFWVGPRWRDRRCRVRRCAVNGALHPVEGHALLRHRQTSDRIGVGLSWRGTHDVLQLEHHHPIRHELRQHPASIKLQGKQALGLSSLKRILDLPQRSASSNTQS